MITYNIMSKEVKESFMETLDRKDRQRLLFALRRREQEENQKYQERVSVGYCPICFCLRTKTGKCTNGCDD